MMNINFRMNERKIDSNRREHEPLDFEWYTRFEPIGSFAVHEYFLSDKLSMDQQRDVFIENRDGNPELNYPKLDRAELKEKERGLLELKKDILERETHEVVKQVYRWKINEKIAELRLMEAALDRNMHKFKRYSEFIYGKPSREIFDYTLSNLRAQVTASLDSQNEELRNAAQDVLNAFPMSSTSSSDIQKPSTKSMERVVESTKKIAKDLISLPEGLEKANAEEIKEVFDYAIRSAAANDWEVVIDSETSKTGISVNQEEKKVIIPSSRSVSVKKLRGLVVHEIGTHVIRRKKGERSRLLLLALGLDRYQGGEEGVATMREQGLKKEFEDFSGLQGHLAISLAKGLDGQPRDFREVYTLLFKYNYWNQLRLKKSPEVAKKEAERLGWNRTMRTFRGTDGKTKGVVFTKDIVYRQGNIAVWNLVGKNSKEMLRLQVGKYDPANERHTWVLDQLEITDEDLENLEV